VADLNFTVENIPQMETAALVKISGAIDAKTVVLFQEKLDQLQGNNYTRFVLDMEGIKYVNSTGLGTLVNVADALETKGGGIALIKIHPKVKVVFDMLGLNAFFKIFSNEDEALAYLAKGPKPTGKPEPTKPSSVSKPEPRPPQAPRTQPPPPTEPSKPPEPPKAPPAGETTTTAVRQSDGSFSVVCAMCKVKLAIPKPGSYKCPRCGTFFKLFENASISFAERKKTPPLQFKLACTDECTEGLCEFIGVLLNRIGFAAADSQDIINSIKEICAAIIEKAYENKQYLSYNVVINTSSRDIKIQFSDFGKYIYDDNVSFAHTKRVMPEFEHKEHPKGGNIIDIGKQLPE